MYDQLVEIEIGGVFSLTSHEQLGHGDRTSV